VIESIGAAGAAASYGVRPTSVTQHVAQPTRTAEAGQAFADLVSSGLQQVSQLEFTADAAIQDVATGGPTRIEDVMIATSQAQLGIDMLARVRDRALEAYQEIMRMPL
jgi:flagellar hook-basal body complex protein FliE